MTDESTADLRRKGRVSFVWLVPLLCLAMVAVYAYKAAAERGPAITILFPDADGLVPGKTAIKYRGVVVGEVTSVELQGSTETVRVGARLSKDAGALAREGTVFVTIKPQVSFQGVEGLTTIFSGAALDMRPGEGAAATEFKGYADARTLALEKPGLLLTLRTPHNGSIDKGEGVFYRGMRVGDVLEVGFSPTGQDVRIEVKIDDRYDHFVRDNSKFWLAGGIDAKMSLFGGAQVKVNSVQALWNGGIAFATPNEPGSRVRSGHGFTLEPKVNPEWESWSPRLSKK